MAVLGGLGVGVHGCEAQGGSHSLHQPGYAQQTDLSSMPANICLSILVKLGRLRLHSPRVEAGPKGRTLFPAISWGVSREGFPAYQQPRARIKVNGHWSSVGVWIS